MLLSRVHFWNQVQSGRSMETTRSTFGRPHLAVHFRTEPVKYTITLKNTYSVHWQGANMRPNDPRSSIQADRNRLTCPDYCPSRLFLNLFQPRSFSNIQNLKLFLEKLRDANFESTQHLQMNRPSLTRFVHCCAVQHDGRLFRYRRRHNVFRNRVLSKSKPRGLK